MDRRGEGENGGASETEAKLKRLQSAEQYDGPHRWVPFMENLDDEKETRSNRPMFLTDWPQFDSMLNGMVPQELTIVSGIQGNGKSLFCRSMAHQFVKQGIPVGYIHFEGSFLDAFQPFEYDPDFKLFVPKKKEAGNPDWIIEQCYRFKAKYDGKIIFLDHLHYIIDMAIKDNMSLNIGALLRTLIAEVCEGLDMAIILVAHQTGIDSKTEPSIDTIRDSSFLKQEPANVIIVHRTPDPAINKEAGISYTGGYAMVKIDKSRRTGAYRQKLTFQKKGAWLEEGV